MCALACLLVGPDGGPGVWGLSGGRFLGGFRAGWGGVPRLRVVVLCCVVVVVRAGVLARNAAVLEGSACLWKTIVLMLRIFDLTFRMEVAP